RVDTTVVETTIQYPTDSGLLADGVRVLTRTMRRLRAHAAAGMPQIRNRARSIARRVFEIGHHTRSATLRVGAVRREKSKARMAVLYREMMAITRAVVRQADTLAGRVPAQATRTVQQLTQRLRGTTELVRRVLAQMRARIVEGNTHYRDKVLSLFEPHTEAIRKGKAAKPTEFGKLVKIQEAEAQFITDYEVCATRVPDGTLWMPSVERHIELFHRPPQLAVADAGFASRANERAAQQRGVRHVVLRPPRGPACPRRVRAAVRWRTGCEGRISVSAADLQRFPHHRPIGQPVGHFSVAPGPDDGHRHRARRAARPLRRLRSPCGPPSARWSDDPPAPCACQAVRLEER